MATTSPDGIRTPDPGDAYNLVSDLATLASDTQAAITKRGNLYIGTSAQRTALTTAATGVNWQDTDGRQDRYRWSGSAWVRLGESFFTGTAAQRTAFTDAPAGTFWQDTDGEKVLFRRDGSSWLQASAGLVRIVPSGVTFVGGTGSTNSTTGKITFTTCTKIQVAGIFSSEYTNYRIVLNPKSSVNFVELNARLMTGTSTENTATLHSVNGILQEALAATSNYVGGNLDSFRWGYLNNDHDNLFEATLAKPFTNSATRGNFQMLGRTAPGSLAIVGSMHCYTIGSFTGLSIYPASGTISGTMQVYGFEE